MSEKTLPVTGGCLCGAVCFQASEPPSYIGHCHCRMCQKASGGVSILWVCFIGEDRRKEGSLRFTNGEPKYYKSSDWLERAFCPNCGSPLGVRTRRGHRSVMIGNLDHPEDWPPNEVHAGIESQRPWNVIHDDRPRWRTEDDPDFRIMTAEDDQGGD